VPSIGPSCGRPCSRLRGGRYNHNCANAPENTNINWNSVIILYSVSNFNNNQPWIRLGQYTVQAIDLIDLCFIFYQLSTETLSYLLFNAILYLFNRLTLIRKVKLFQVFWKLIIFHKRTTFTELLLNNKQGCLTISIRLRIELPSRVLMRAYIA